MAVPGRARRAAARFADLVDWVEEHFPPGTAESWDRVGVVCGDPADPLQDVLLTVDVTPAVVAEAIDSGVQAIIAHHPLLLRGVHGIDARTPKGRMVQDLIRNRIGLITAHTNGDSATHGVGTALATAIGLTGQTPLAPASSAALDQLVTFVPTDHLAPVVDALAAAGAGAIGDYDRCHFHHGGTGSFRPTTGADPFIGSVDEVAQVPEERLEMVLPRSVRGPVLAALKSAHPYEEPAYHVLELASEAADTGLGRVGELPEPMSARAFAARLSGLLPETVTGVRMAGDPERRIQTVAVLPGAGDSMLDQARGRGVDAYITSDLRHHPAAEFIEHDDAPVLFDIAHWAAEQTWLPLLASLLSESGPGVGSHISQVRTDPWSLRV